MNNTQISLNISEIKKNFRVGDYDRVAYICGCTGSLVNKVVHGVRNDHKGIIAAYSMLITQRNQLEIDLRNQYYGTKSAKVA